MYYKSSLNYQALRCFVIILFGLLFSFPANAESDESSETKVITITNMKDHNVTLFADVNKLIIEDSSFSDLSLLKDAKELKELVLEGTKVKDLKALVNHPKLERIVLNKTLITEIKVLTKLKNLKRVWLNHTKVQDLSPLYGLPKLKLVWIMGASVGGEEYRAFKIAMPNCGL